MAAITKTGTPGLDAISGSRCVMISELFSGDSFAFLDPVYIDTDGKVYAAKADSVQIYYDGFASRASDSNAGVAVTVLGFGAILEWIDAADSIAPSTLLYVGASGGLDNAASPATADPVAKAITATEILVIK